MTINKILPKILVLVVLFGGIFVSTEYTVAQETATGLAQLSQCTGTDCSACHIVRLINGGIKWLIGITFMLFAVLLAVAGFNLVVSAGNPSALSAAKEKFANAIIGLIIILAAWLIVDTLMRTLVGNADNKGSIGIIKDGKVTSWLFWSKLECQILRRPTEEKIPELGFELEPIPDSENLISPTQIGGVTTVSPAGVYHPSTSVPPDGTFTYQGNIAVQRPHASSELEMLLRCMASQVPGNVGELSSISDSNIVNGSKTWQQCWEGSCQHTGGSCHYGNGYGTVGRSYAVDFGDENNATDLIGAAYACGAKHASVHNGNHVHVTSAACKNN